MTPTDALARALDIQDDRSYCHHNAPSIAEHLAALGYEVRPICTTCTALHSVRSASGMPIHQAAEAADPSAAADPVTAPANSSSTRYELYGPRRYPEPGEER